MPGYCAAFRVYIQKDSHCKSFLNLYPPPINLATVCVQCQRSSVYYSCCACLLIMLSHRILKVAYPNGMFTFSQLYLRFVFCSPNIEPTTWTLQPVHNKCGVAIYKRFDIILATWSNICEVVGIDHVITTVTVATCYCLLLSHVLWGAEVRWLCTT